jgi:hypothetical protein
VKLTLKHSLWLTGRQFIMTLLRLRAMASYVGTIATNYDVDSHDGWVARYFLDVLRQVTGNKPIMISEWIFAARENRTGIYIDRTTAVEPHPRLKVGLHSK